MKRYKWCLRITYFSYLSQDYPFPIAHNSILSSRIVSLDETLPAFPHSISKFRQNLETGDS